MSNVFELGGPDPQPQRVNVNLGEAQDITCDKCGAHFFHEVTFFKRLSPLMSPTGKEAIVPLQTYACLECGNINPDFLPSGFGNNG